jgi:tRNA(adenine34) deaminase
LIDNKYINTVDGYMSLYFSCDKNFDDTAQKDEYFMTKAINEASKAFEMEEVPVGAVLVHNNQIIARGHNQVEMLKDATAHAEMICMTSGAAYLNNWRLKDTTLYCTLEPCCMCAGAMMLARVGRLVWAAPDLRLGANGSYIDVFSQKHPFHEIKITSGVLGDVSVKLMKDFFTMQRKKSIDIN